MTTVAIMVNPFSTRHTRPGCIVPLDGDGAPLDVGTLLERLRDVGGTGAIVGPHGSGKSGLLLHLAETLEARGTRVRRVRLRTSRDAWQAVGAIRSAGRSGTVCLDGWECLAAPVRGLLRLLSWAAGCGLIVTAHRRGRLPVLATCRTSVALLDSIVGRLPGKAVWYGTLIRPEDVRSAYERRRGDVREALYELYDVFERRSRGGMPHRS